MKKKTFALATGAISALGLLAFLRHKKQVNNQKRHGAILVAIRAFFEPMGSIDVSYLMEENNRLDKTCGGVVFDDGVVVEFCYDKGQINHRQIKGGY